MLSGITNDAAEHAQRSKRKSCAYCISMTSRQTTNRVLFYKQTKHEATHPFVVIQGLPDV